MVDEPQRSIAESVRGWVQAVALPILALVWTVWAFYYKEIWLPAKTPIILTTDLTVKEAGLNRIGDASAQLEAYEITVTARNPTSRSVFLLENMWMAYGAKIEAKEAKEVEPDWQQRSLEDINVRNTSHMQGRFFKSGRVTLLDMGAVFQDLVLKENETKSASLLVYVPRGEYDSVFLHAEIPTATKEDPAHPGHPQAKIAYTQEEPDFVSYKIYRVKQDGTLEELPKEEGNYLDRDERALGLQIFVLEKEFSLWKGEPSPTEKAHETSSPNLSQGIH